MPLHATPISRNTDMRRAVKNIYLSSFPKEERLPFPLLRAFALWRGVDFTAYTDGEKALGFTYTIAADDILFVLFFAVDETDRGRGVGSAILSELKAKSRAVVLNIEPLDPHAGNYEERCRRFRFYEKNGFYDTGRDIREVGGVFRVLSTDQTIDIKEVFRKIAFGRFKVFDQKH